MMTEAKDLLFITHATAAILGLDDMARYPDIDRRVCYPGSVRGGLQCYGTREALTDLVTEINDRATEGADGYDESARNKRILARAIASLRRRGWTPRP